MSTTMAIKAFGSSRDSDATFSSLPGSKKSSLITTSASASRRATDVTVTTPPPPPHSPLFAGLIASRRQSESLSASSVGRKIPATRFSPAQPPPAAPARPAASVSFTEAVIVPLGDAVDLFIGSPQISPRSRAVPRDRDPSSWRWQVPLLLELKAEQAGNEYRKTVANSVPVASEPSVVRFNQWQANQQQQLLLLQQQIYYMHHRESIASGLLGAGGRRKTMIFSNTPSLDGSFISENGSLLAQSLASARLTSLGAKGNEPQIDIQVSSPVPAPSTGSSAGTLGSALKKKPAGHASKRLSFAVTSESAPSSARSTRSHSSDHSSNAGGGGGMLLLAPPGIPINRKMSITSASSDSGSRRPSRRISNISIAEEPE